MLLFGFGAIMVGLVKFGTAEKANESRAKAFGMMVFGAVLARMDTFLLLTFALFGGETATNLSRLIPT